MKVLVIGLGSMGKRRIRLLKKHFDNIQVIGIERDSARRSEVEQIYNVKTYENLDIAIDIEKPNGVLVCTPPISHANIILNCLNKKLHVFTEINLVNDGYLEMENLAKENRLELFLSSTFLYRKEIQFIQQTVELHIKDTKLHYRYHVGQYLPDWHPWESYKDFFVNNKKSNGCRELFAIELPWLLKTFGKVTNFKVIKDRISSLDLDYPDSYIVLLEHESGSKGVLNVDIVSRKPVRSLEIYSEKLHLFWEGTPDSLKKYDINKKEIIHIETYRNIDKDNRYSENIIENAYLEELAVFINNMLGKEKIDRYGFEDDIYTLDLIDKIEGVV